MPHAWALVDSSFPTFSQGEKTGDKITKLVDYMKILVEALQYQLENLDTANWNAAALQTFQTDTTEDVEASVAGMAQQLAALNDEVRRISGALGSTEGHVKQLETDTGYLQKDMEEIKTDVVGLEEQIADAQADVDELKETLAGAVQKDENGNATLGTEGKDLYLVGRIYVNGILLE